MDAGESSTRAEPQVEEVVVCMQLGLYHHRSIANGTHSFAGIAVNPADDRRTRSGVDGRGGRSDNEGKARGKLRGKQQELKTCIVSLILLSIPMQHE